MTEPEAFFAAIEDGPIDRQALETFVLSSSDGALVVFEGVIRDHDHGSAVTALEARLTACEAVRDDLLPGPSTCLGVVRHRTALKVWRRLRTKPVEPSNVLARRP